MDEQLFIDHRLQSWESLSQIVKEAERHGPRRLSASQLSSLSLHYRQVVSDLAYARSKGASDGLISYLNDLAGRAHGTLYYARPARLRGLGGFVVRDFPVLFRSTIVYTICAAFVFFGSWMIPATNPDIRDAVFPKKIVAPDNGDHTGRLFEDIDPSFMSGAIMANNIQVGILAFAGGITAGTVTVYQLASNGMIIGAITSKASKALGRKRFWALILPHGIIELTAICICGGAGFMLGYAIIAPGNLRRTEALRRSGTKAVRLFAGAVLMFVVAGIIEGVVTPSALTDTSKLVFAAATAFALASYLFLTGARTSTAAPRESRGATTSQLPLRLSRR